MQPTFWRSDVCDLIIGVAAGVAGVLVVVGGLTYRLDFSGRASIQVLGGEAEAYMSDLWEAPMACNDSICLLKSRFVSFWSCFLRRSFTFMQTKSVGKYFGSMTKHWVQLGFGYTIRQVVWAMLRCVSCLDHELHELHWIALSWLNYKSCLIALHCIGLH